jgi:hypothetical protein
MNAMPQTTNPLIAATQEAVPSVQAAFLKRFDKSIDVSVHKVMNPETNEPAIEFRFIPAKPGLLPTATERAWFDGFMAGYQRCHFVVVDLFTIGEAPN